MFKYKEQTFVRIVYAKVKNNGKSELVPFRLYQDGHLEPNY
ncbi:hypothetical protein [Limnofasciculus baicalensis]|nr:hypothetical protein [Limnofasciculus baicalensis]